MPSEEVPPGTPPAQQPAGGASAAPASNPGTSGGGNAAPQKPAGNADVVTFPRASMRRFKQEEREAGQKALAKELGYESVEAMKSVIAAAKKQPPTAKPKPNGSGSLQAPATQRDPALERELAEVRRLNKLNSQRFAEFKQEAYAAQADLALQQEAQSLGCTEPKLALYLLKDKMAEVSVNARRMGKDREDRKRREQKALTEFDRAKFYVELQKERPYLFGAKQAPAPATTGTGNSTNGNPPPRPGSGPQNGAAFNALEAKNEDVRKYAGKLGIKWPTS
jgi:hypothetical protein